MTDEKILDNAVLRLAQAPQGCGLRVHEYADCFTADVLTVLNQRGWIEWRQWCRSESGPRPYLNEWSAAFVHDWASFLAEYRREISPEIRLSLKGESRAAEARLACGEKRSANSASEPTRIAGWRDVGRQVIAGLLIVVIVAIAIWKWPWIKEFLG